MYNLNEELIKTLFRECLRFFPPGRTDLAANVQLVNNTDKDRIHPLIPRIVEVLQKIPVKIEKLVLHINNQGNSCFLFPTVLHSPCIALSEQVERVRGTRPILSSQLVPEWFSTLGKEFGFQFQSLHLVISSTGSEIEFKRTVFVNLAEKLVLQFESSEYELAPFFPKRNIASGSPTQLDNYLSKLSGHRINTLQEKGKILQTEDGLYTISFFDNFSRSFSRKRILPTFQLPVNLDSQFFDEVYTILNLVDEGGFDVFKFELTFVCDDYAWFSVEGTDGSAIVLAVNRLKEYLRGRK